MPFLFSLLLYSNKSQLSADNQKHRALWVEKVVSSNMVCRRQHECAELTGIHYLLLSLLQLSSSRITSHTHTHTHPDLFHVPGAVLWGT